MNIKEIRLKDYHYELPQERIAQRPLEKRDHSKLLYYRRGKIEHKHFYNLPELLPEHSLLVFNNTKVIPARCFFQRQSGAWIEIFLLDPTSPSAVIEEVMQSTDFCEWRCMIGNLKKWKEGEVLEMETHLGKVQARLLERQNTMVRLEWEGNFSFSEIIYAIGSLPLPPYIKRKAENADEQQYQTIYARAEGAVAAPTAGLHFSESVFDGLRQQHIDTAELTLHVGAGTFQPVSSEMAAEHNMHSERFEVRLDTLKKLIGFTDRTLVGTTSLRTMESLYWMGIKLLKNLPDPNKLSKLEAYELAATAELPSYENALQVVISWLEQNGKTSFNAETAIYIMPGYRIRSCNRLITNFHMPETTLILLVAAFIGADWKIVYDAALRNDYRFLSYGDSSLLEFNEMASVKMSRA